MQEDNTYVAYEQEEQFWTENEHALKKEHPKPVSHHQWRSGDCSGGRLFLG